MNMKPLLIFALMNTAYAQNLIQIPMQSNENVEDKIINFDDIPPVLEDNIAPYEAIETFIPEPLLQSAAILGDKSSDDIRIALVNARNLSNLDLTEKFYSSQNYPSFWNNKLRYQLINLVEDSSNDALPSNRYHLDQLDNPLNPETEILLTDAYLSLMSDLANGLVNPRKTQPEWNAEKVSDEEMIETFANGVLKGEISEQIQSLNDNNPRYIALKKRYQALKLATENSSEKLPKVTLKPYTKHAAVEILRRKLGVDSEGHFYDDALIDAVKSFQKHVGLNANGVVDGQTRLLLNSDKKQLMNQLAINMERQRWLPQNLGDTNIIVNIPSYYVEMFQNGKRIYRTRAVVGKPSRPTPTFVDKLRHVVMSPTWTVPPTILKKDKMPQLLTNPAAFDGAYDAIGPGGRVTTPSSVNWASAKNYTLRQKPGAQNALGKVKFLFPNKHAIYLHDTPSKSLFNKPNRAYSSGCVRIQDPTDFANILLKNTNWTSEKINKAMNQSKETWVNNPAIPIYLVYWTAWSSLDGKVQFAQDIYNKDAALLKQYQAAFN